MLSHYHYPYRSHSTDSLVIDLPFELTIDLAIDLAIDHTMDPTIDLTVDLTIDLTVAPQAPIFFAGHHATPRDTTID